MAHYLEAGRHGTLADVSRDLVAIARGDEDPDLIIRNGELINVHTGEIMSGMDLVIANGRIVRITDTGEVTVGDATDEIDADGQYLAPGFLDTHVHYESSMVTATGFCRGVLPTGTTGAFMDPHEIGNVLGLDGIRLLLDEAAELPLKTFCTIPSCVPAAPGFEDAGATIDADDVQEALEWDDVNALGEMMSYPGVVHGDEEVHDKLAATYEANLEATGHFASRETGASLDAFIAAGISSCHESIRKEEALARLRRGMWTMLRQGSAWKDIPETIKAVTETDVDTRHLLLVSDDTHPDTITEEGHLDRVLQVAISNGLDPVTAIQAVTINAAEYYGVDSDIGALSPGKIADVVFLDELATVDVSRVMINGEVVVADSEWVVDDALPDEEEHTASIRDAYPDWARNTVHIDPPEAATFDIQAPAGAETVEAEVIRVHENQVVTSRETATFFVDEGTVVHSDEVSKAAVIERHGGDESIGRGFVTGFGFERGAVASTVAHDSHNLLIVGTDAEAMSRAAERAIELDGGMVAVDDAVLADVPLPIAGLMSDLPLSEVSDRVRELEHAWRELGCDLDSPFMTMSLLALAVLPEMRVTNRGLVDTVDFGFVDPVNAD